MSRSFIVDDLFRLRFPIIDPIPPPAVIVFDIGNKPLRPPLNGSKPPLKKNRNAKGMKTDLKIVEVLQKKNHPEF